MQYRYLESSAGRLLLAADNSALRYLLFSPATPDPAWTESANAILDAISQQLREYFAGKRTHFDVPIAPQGTAFQRTVWNLLQQIPYGETISYSELATRYGNPKATRAVGAANGKNPISIVIPCHRVVATNGSLWGYGGGLPAKRWLLDLESPNSKLDLAPPPVT
jgi:methylated-DNA-[protein]-cysteine S-methyltransferase